MNTPKKHHYVPQWLIRKWASDKGKVFGISRRDLGNLRLFRSKPLAVNMQNNLYSYEQSDGTKDARLETQFYAPLDGAASKLTNEIVSTLEDGKQPVLDEKARRLLWQFYMYNSRKRHPDAWDKYLSKVDYSSVKERTIQALVEKGVESERARKEVESVDVDAKVRSLSIQKARAIQSEDVLDIFQNIGVRYCVAPEGTSFILPDVPFKEITTNPDDARPIWFPIDPKYAISPYGLEGGHDIQALDKAQIRAINETWYRQSTTIIATTEAHLKSLAKFVDGQAVSL